MFLHYTLCTNVSAARRRNILRISNFNKEREDQRAGKAVPWTAQEQAKPCSAIPMPRPWNAATQTDVDGD